MKTAPLLSIGMIFKNEERCIERCLQSLEPLRQAIPCELIMADTGAEDGSREIAQRYADEVFDFPWIDDFSAARNAVMDRCRGKWYFSIDCDEWLDEDISGLVRFLKSKEQPEFGVITVRNYSSPELEKSDTYSEFLALRLARMDTECRYQGTIHEFWSYQDMFVLPVDMILHHDGYVYVDQKAKKEKLKRNMTLLRKKLEDDPENLFTILQCMESGVQETDYLELVRNAVKAVREKRTGWNFFGGAILRHAAEAARTRELPEFEEWVALGEKMFPESIHIRVDLNAIALLAAHDTEEWEKAVRYGEGYQKGLRVLHAARQSNHLKEELGRNPVYYGGPGSERSLLIGLADAYCKNNQSKKALAILTEIDGAALSSGLVRNATIILTQLHAQSTQDVTPVLTAFYNQISREDHDKQKARLSAFEAIAATTFTKKYQNEEKGYDNYHRPAYTAFRCLADRCEAGRAAEMMLAIDPVEIRSWLAKVENWQALPIEALEYALREEVAFPLAEKPLPVEVLDGLAARLTCGDNMARQMTLALSDDAEFPGLQNLFWAQSLAIAALRSFDWTLGKNAAPVSEFACPEKEKESDEKPEDTPETGLALIRRFAQIESAVLPLLYTPQMLAEENAALLPPMHRWGLYCSLAFEALDAGRPQEHLALLRKGLAACPGEKNMVQFLLERFMEDARPKASAELLALAERVRTILASYDPNDPAVAALKVSAAYRQVAWLIEPEPAGKLVQ